MKFVQYHTIVNENRLFYFTSSQVLLIKKLLTSNFEAHQNLKEYRRIQSNLKNSQKNKTFQRISKNSEELRRIRGGRKRIQRIKKDLNRISRINESVSKALESNV